MFTQASFLLWDPVPISPAGFVWRPRQVMFPSGFLHSSVRFWKWSWDSLFTWTWRCCWNPTLEPLPAPKTGLSAWVLRQGPSCPSLGAHLRERTLPHPWKNAQGNSSWSSWVQQQGGSSLEAVPELRAHLSSGDWNSAQNQKAEDADVSSMLRPGTPVV